MQLDCCQCDCAIGKEANVVDDGVSGHGLADSRAPAVDQRSGLKMRQASSAIINAYRRLINRRFEQKACNFAKSTLVSTNGSVTRKWRQTHSLRCPIAFIATDDTCVCILYAKSKPDFEKKARAVVLVGPEAVEARLQARRCSSRIDVRKLVCTISIVGK